MRLVNLSALWRVNLWVTLCFALVTLACAGVLLHQAVADVERELQSAEAVVAYLGDTAERDPANLQPGLTKSLRHVRVHWLAAGEVPRLPQEAGIDAWLGRQLFGERYHSSRLLDLSDGRRVLIAVDARDEIDEVWDSLQQLLGVCGLALLLSLWTIRWAVRRAMGLLDELLGALHQVSGGQLTARLREAGLPEARQLAKHFNRMAATLEQAQADNAQLTQALLAVQEQERTQLAQTLHDDLGQYLAGMRAQLCLLRMVAEQPEMVTQTVQALELNCERLQQGFRALVHNLYPVALHYMPLAEAFGLLVSQWQASQGIECRLRVGEHFAGAAWAEQNAFVPLAAGGVDQRRPACRCQPGAGAPAAQSQGLAPVHSRQWLRRPPAPAPRGRPALDGRARPQPWGVTHFQPPWRRLGAGP